MSLLLGHFFEQDEPQEQKFRILRSVTIGHLRVALFKNGHLPSGNLTATLLDGSETIKSGVVTHTQLNTSGNFTWGFFDVLGNFRISGRRSGEQYHEYSLEINWDGPKDLLAWLVDYEKRRSYYGGVDVKDNLLPKRTEFYYWR